MDITLEFFFYFARYFFSPYYIAILSFSSRLYPCMFSFACYSLVPLAISMLFHSLRGFLNERSNDYSRRGPPFSATTVYSGDILVLVTRSVCQQQTETQILYARQDKLRAREGMSEVEKKICIREGIYV